MKTEAFKKTYDVLVPCEVSRFTSRGIFSGGDDSRACARKHTELECITNKYRNAQKIRCAGVRFRTSSRGRSSTRDVPKR